MLQQMFRKFEISNRLSNSYFRKIDRVVPVVSLSLPAIYFSEDDTLDIKCTYNVLFYTSNLKQLTSPVLSKQNPFC